jgi:carbamoyltransferase
MNILGLSCYYHDSAAALVRDGEVVAAAQEERFNRDKYSPEFPARAVNYCLQSAGLTMLDVDAVAFYEKPYLKFSRIILGHLKAWPFSMGNFLDTMPLWLRERLSLPVTVRRELAYSGETLFIKHHLAHAASAFLVSPFEEAAILTVDGVGESATTTFGYGRGRDIKILKEIRYPDSVGLLYAIVTTYLGFPVFAGEGKVMGLAATGSPRFLDKFREVMAVRPDGSFRLNPDYFTFNRGDRMYGRRFTELFGPDRKPGEELDERHRDIAASLQRFTEEVLLAMARHVHAVTKMDRLCLAGGVFLNCTANARLLEETPFKELYIQPAAGDAGGALGAAVYAYHMLSGKPRSHVLEHPYLGPDLSQTRAKRLLTNAGLKFTELTDEELPRRVGKLLADGKIVGWVQGRMEFGPRALGNRSILADPRNPEMWNLLNEKVKSREPFRPYAPAVQEERAHEFFDLKAPSPFMLLAAPVREGMARLIPAVTHSDGSARMQTVSRSTNPRFWELIGAFGDITGVPVLLNTSFNLRDEPMVCGPEDAILDFQRSRMDCLVLGNLLTERES